MKRLVVQEVEIVIRIVNVIIVTNELPKCFSLANATGLEYLDCFSAIGSIRWQVVVLKISKPYQAFEGVSSEYWVWVRQFADQEFSCTGVFARKSLAKFVFFGNFKVGADPATENTARGQPLRNVFVPSFVRS